MATAPQIVPQGDAPPKVRRTRSASVAKPAFFIIQILDEQGTANAVRQEACQADQCRAQLLTT